VSSRLDWKCLPGCAHQFQQVFFGISRYFVLRTKIEISSRSGKVGDVGVEMTFSVYLSISGATERHANLPSLHSGFIDASASKGYACLSQRRSFSQQSSAAPLLSTSTCFPSIVFTSDFVQGWGWPLQSMPIFRPCICNSFDSWPRAEHTACIPGRPGLAWSCTCRTGKTRSVRI
jgi:hypothetical protein